MNKKSNFDILAEGLSKQEKSDMLDQINRRKNAYGSSDGNESEQEDDIPEESSVSLSDKFKSEPFFFKIFIWVKSLVFNSTVEDTYNASLVFSLAKKIEHDYPDFIDIKRKRLSSGFYNVLMELKSPYDFFRPVVDSVNPDVFYFILGTLIMPEVVDDIKSSCDVYKYPLTKPVPADTRNLLMSKLDEILSDLPSDKKASMSSCSREFEWLKMFVKLPLGNILNKFTSDMTGRKCLFSQIKPDFDNLARIVESAIPCSDNVLLCMYQTLMNPKNLWSYVLSSDESVFEKIKESSSEISVIDTFINKIPVRKLGKIIFENSIYYPEKLNFGDGWIQKYREQWRVLLDRRWKFWNRDFKKESLKKKIKVYFGLNDFPKFPYHPWQRFENDIYFKYDLSLGFLNYYLKKEYPKYMTVINIVTLEGDFSIKENRLEFTDMISNINAITGKNNMLVQQVSASGDYGSVFFKYQDNEDESVIEYVSPIINEIEDLAYEMTDSFVKLLKNFETLLLALLGDKPSVSYGPLVNLERIMGYENREFRMSLERFVHSIKYADEVMTSIQEIEGMSS